MALQADKIADITKVTLDNLEPLKWSNIALALQHYPAMSQFLKKNRVMQQSGDLITRQLMVEVGNAARNVGLYATDQVNVADVMQTISIPWRNTTHNYAMDRREVKMNREPSRIVDIMKIRRADCMNAIAERMETDFWGTPLDDTTTPYGVKYWNYTEVESGTGSYTDHATGDDGDFLDVAHGTFSSGPGGVSPVTYPRWGGYNHQYTNKTKDDMIRKMRRAKRKIHFLSPVKTPSHNRGSDQYVIYTNYDVIAAMETLAEQQNDQLGRDVASMDGKVTFRGNTVQWVPELDSDSTDPIHFLNWAVFYIVVLKGEYLTETQVKQAPNQHTVSVVHMDLTWNTLCTDRRRLAVLSAS